MKSFVLMLIVGGMLCMPASAYAAYAESVISISFDKTVVTVGDYIEATVSVKNLATESITVPVHFNANVVKISDMDGTVTVSGVKTIPSEGDGGVGLIPGQAVSGNPLYWDGAVLENAAYPEVNNEKGLCRLMFLRSRSKAIVSETLISIKFIAVAAGDADIRFATNKDEAFDIVSPGGATYLYKASEGLISNFVHEPFATVEVGKAEVKAKPLKRTVKNISGKRLDCVSIIAAYNKDKLVDLSIKEISVPAGGSYVHEYDMKVLPDTVKHFFCDAVENIMPLLNAATSE